MLRTAEDLYGLQASLLRTLASPRRLEILHLLGTHPMEVRELAQITGMAQPTVSAHLGALRSVGIVDAVRSGREVTYCLTDDRIVTACEMVRDVLARRLERLNLLILASAPAGAPEPPADPLVVLPLATGITSAPR